MRILISLFLWAGISVPFALAIGRVLHKPNLAEEIESYLREPRVGRLLRRTGATAIALGLLFGIVLLSADAVRHLPTTAELAQSIANATLRDPATPTARAGKEPSARGSRHAAPTERPSSSFIVASLSRAETVEPTPPEEAEPFLALHDTTSDTDTSETPDARDNRTSTRPSEEMTKPKQQGSTENDRGVPAAAPSESPPSARTNSPPSTTTAPPTTTTMAAPAPTTTAAEPAPNTTHSPDAAEADDDDRATGRQGRDARHTKGPQRRGHAKPGD